MKRFKKAAALTVSAVMTVGAASAVFAAATPDQGQIDVDITVENPIFEVTLPTALSAALDPFEMAEEGQLYSSEQGALIINKTNVPVKVEFDFTARLYNDAEFLTPDDLDLDTEDPEKKAIYLGVEVADEITFNGDDIDTISYEEANPEDTDGSFVPFVGKWTNAGHTDTDPMDAAKSFISFALDKAQFSGEAYQEPAANSAGVAAFRLYASLNPYAPTGQSWTGEDVKIVANYKLKAYSKARYTEVATSGMAADAGLNLITRQTPSDDLAEIGGVVTPETPVETPVGFTQGETPANSQMYTVSKATVPSGGYTVPFNFGGYTITEVKVNGTTLLAEGTDYANQDGNFVIKKSRTDAFTNGAKAITIKLSNTQTYTLNITVTA
ncbi:MAG: hypothetical protein LBS84_12105 [Clostridiales bacterium]|jgi:hypothetical protein|nr:hypothetical protein [Clostridiales bacterium]